MPSEETPVPQQGRIHASPDPSALMTILTRHPAEPIEPHWVDVLRTYGEGFAGRTEELAALHRAWNEGVRVFVLYAQGGAGKTRVVAKWLTEMRDAGWRGAGRVFVHSFYSQGTAENRNASSELFFEQALRHFGHPGPPLTDPAEKGRTLARLLIEQRGLLVLDGIEPLQHPPAFDQGRLKDPALHSLFRSLAAGRIAETGGGLCIVTSRQPIIELQDKTGRMVVQQPLERLDAEAGVELLRQLEVRGPERELREAVEDAHGHAYSLMLLGSYLRDATDDHEIRRRREIPLLEEDKEHRYHARHLFGAYVKHLGESSPEIAVLRLLGFFDRPAEKKLLSALREGIEAELSRLAAPLRKLSSADWRRVLGRLAALRLIDIPVSPSPPIDSHPLLREYFAEQLQTCFPEAWRAGHRRLFKHLCETTEHQPSTLASSQPLYQAVAHGCLAGLHQQALREVYIERILRGTGHDGFYNRKKLGAIGADLGAVACFFIKTWTTLTPNLSPTDQAWLLNQAATRLRAMGRLTEAIEPMQAAMDMCIEREDWKAAPRIAINLIELELTRGEVTAAVTAGERSVTYADYSKEYDWWNFAGSRAALADAVHQAGRRTESRRLFEDAEQAVRQVGHPWLYSLWGFQYSDLLLADAERETWQRWLDEENGPRQLLTTNTAACDSARERAAYALRIANHNRFLLDLGLDHLTLARVTLYKGEPVHHHVTAAVDNLRAAGDMTYLPRGLLVRAWVRLFSDDEPSCQADLDEAWEIAERGPMPLLQADILLTRARLFRDRTALAEARRLIEKHGYHRRDEELADAEEAAKGWPETPESESLNPNEEPRSNEGSMQDQVFISYSHRDKKFMEELRTQLKPFLRSGTIKAWSDQQIPSGAKWFDEIQAALGKTKAAVFLVSPDFLASDFIHDHELGPLLKRAEAGGVKILWVPLRASAYEETPLNDYQAVSSPDEPLAKMSRADRDEAWVRICKEIKRAVNS
jgi:hypothetical protein